MRPSSIILNATLCTAALMTATSAAAMEQDMPASCEMAFFQSDQNDDGMIDEDESANMRDVVFEGLDLNANGSIDRTEYVACTQMSAAADARTANQAQGELNFEKLDTDGDGRVSITDYFDRANEAYQNSFAPGAPAPELATSFDQPFVYIPEDMTVEGTDMQDKSTFMDAAARSFRTIDKDLDGALTRSEWLDRADDYEIDIERINQRFDSMDSNTDEQVDRSEFDMDWQRLSDEAASQAARDGFTDASKGIPAYFFYFRAV